jgi:hypothetical protein
LATVKGAVSFIENAPPVIAPSEDNSPLKSVLLKLKLAEPAGPSSPYRPARVS